MKEVNLNETAKKVLFWYENHPNGPVEPRRRNFGRDCGAVKRDFFGDQAKWEELCQLGWNHRDAMVQHYSRLRITAFLSMVPKIIEAEKPSDAERAAAVRAIDAMICGIAEEKVATGEPKWIKTECGYARVN